MTIMTKCIVVKGTNWLGDAIMSLPTIYGLKKMFPEYQLHVLTKSYLSDLYSMFPFISKTLSYNNTSDAISQLKQSSAESCLILPRSFISAWICYKAGVEKRIGYKSEFRNILLTNSMNRNSNVLRTHRTYYYYNLLNAFATPPNIEKATLNFHPNSLNEANEILKEIDTSNKPIVGMSPGAMYGDAKQWPPVKFSNLGKKLINEFNCNIIILGSTAEKQMCQSVSDNIGKGAFNFAGKTSLTLLAALINRCKVYLTNDSGSMHFADLLNIPIIAIFGSTDPQTTKPFGDNHVIIRHPIECSPCLQRSSPLIHHNCMEMIKYEDVFSACFRFLNN